MFDQNRRKNLYVKVRIHCEIFLSEDFMKY